MNGLRLNALYAYKPNSLGYCGPDKSGVLLRYLKGEKGYEEKVKEHFTQFAAVYPYLQLIAEKTNSGIFDLKTVEAYWLGNSKLDGIQTADLRRMAEEKFIPLMGSLPEIPEGCKPCHAFHVIFLTSVTGKLQKTIQNQNLCRISWGVISSTDRNKITVVYSPLIFENKKLKLGAPVRKVIDSGFIEKPKVGEMVTFHWEMGIQKISKKQRETLEECTRKHVDLYNTYMI